MTLQLPYQSSFFNFVGGNNTIATAPALTINQQFLVLGVHATNKTTTATTVNLNVFKSISSSTFRVQKLSLGSEATVDYTTLIKLEQGDRVELELSGAATSFLEGWSTDNDNFYSNNEWGFATSDNLNLNISSSEDIDVFINTAIDGES